MWHQQIHVNQHHHKMILKMTNKTMQINRRLFLNQLRH